MVQPEQPKMYAGGKVHVTNGRPARRLDTEGPAAEAAPYRPEGRRERCRVSTEKGNAAALSKVPGRLASQRFSAYNIGNFLYIPCLGM